MIVLQRNQNPSDHTLNAVKYTKNNHTLVEMKIKEKKLFLTRT